MQTATIILLLCIGVYFLLCGTAKLLKALDIKIERKPAPMSEAEEEALKAYKQAEEKSLNAMNKLFNFGGGADE